MDRLTIITIYERFKSETPNFWKKIRWLMVSCGTIGVAIAAVPEQYTLWMPANIPGIMITAGAIGTTFAQLTVKDKKENEQ